MQIRERMTLQIAAATYRYPAQREEDYALVVGYSPARASQVILALLDRADAEAEMPAVVRRLRRVREARARVRGSVGLSAVHGVPTGGSGGAA